MKSKAMIIGAIDAGKTTLMHELLGNSDRATKTQTLAYNDWLVDTPGEYTENPLYYKNIMATSFQVTHVIYVQDATANKSIFPPGFAGGIPKLRIGVITKADHTEANIERAISQLRRVMIKGPIVITSAKDATGIEHIKPLVACGSLMEMKTYIESNLDDTIMYIGE